MKKALIVIVVLCVVAAAAALGFNYYAQSQAKRYGQGVF